MNQSVSQSPDNTIIGWSFRPEKHAVICLFHSRIWNFNRLCVMIMSLSCNLVLWYEQNKKLRDIWLCFPIPGRALRKPTWRSRAWWLTKLAWYGVPWKPTIVNLDQKRVFLHTLDTFGKYAMRNAICLFVYCVFGPLFFLTTKKKQTNKKQTNKQ